MSHPLNLLQAAHTNKRTSRYEAFLPPRIGPTAPPLSACRSMWRPLQSAARAYTDGAGLSASLAGWSSASWERRELQRVRWQHMEPWGSLQRCLLRAAGLAAIESCSQHRRLLRADLQLASSVGSDCNGGCRQSIHSGDQQQAPKESGRALFSAYAKLCRDGPSRLSQ